MIFQLVTQLKKNPGAANRCRTYQLLVTSPNALPLSYKRLMGAMATIVLMY